MDDSNDRLRSARLRRFGKDSSASAVAKRHGWKVSTYASHENGQTPVPKKAAHMYAKVYKVRAGWILTGEGRMDAPNLVKVMGRIGAGAQIEPEFEQVPEEGLEEIELPVTVGVEAIAFEVVGDSMQPKYDPGDLVICSIHPRNPEEFLNKLVAVRTSEGERYLKKLRHGSKRGLYTLESFNSTNPIEDVKIAWVGEVLATVPAHRRVAEKKAAG